jgi:hypothetical protein
VRPIITIPKQKIDFGKGQKVSPPASLASLFAFVTESIKIPSSLSFTPFYLCPTLSPSTFLLFYRYFYKTLYFTLSFTFFSLSFYMSSFYLSHILSYSLPFNLCSVLSLSLSLFTLTLSYSHSLTLSPFLSLLLTFSSKAILNLYSLFTFHYNEILSLSLSFTFSKHFSC